MRRLLMATAAAAALAVPAVGVAAPTPDATKNANAACTALRAKMGAPAFAQAYRTFGRCVSALAPVEQQNIASAQAACTTEQSDSGFAAAHAGKTFDQFYGVGKNAKNAFGNCVSTKAKASSQAEQQARPNPSRTCRALRSGMTKAVFAMTYGKNANDRNAMGKCVSTAAHKQSQNELNAATACRADQADATFAAAHAGKTFAQFYGTDAADSNAFGKCVSAKAHAAAQAQQQATISAAKTCMGEMRTDAAAFRSKYRTFGRCVSFHAGK